MKTTKFYISLCLLFSFTTMAYSQENNQEDSKKTSINIMTYNIRNGVGIDDVRDYSRTADVIKKWQPDIVAVQEIDSITNRSKQKFVIEEIANLSAMYYRFAPAINYDGGKYGIGILSKEEPLNFYYIPLPGREEKRTFMVAEFNDFFFICVHLSLTAEDQIESIDIIADEVKKMNKPVIVAGDFNAEPDSKTIKLFSEDFEILSPLGAKTYPADEPVEAIDYIAINKGDAINFKLQKVDVLDEPYASDHRPILLELIPNIR